MANEVDSLMDLDPLDLTAENIDSIIAYHRKGRANAAAGIKAKRETGPKLDISDALKGMFEEVKPAASTGIRRR